MKAFQTDFINTIIICLVFSLYLICHDIAICQIDLICGIVLFYRHSEVITPICWQIGTVRFSGYKKFKV